MYWRPTRWTRWDALLALTLAIGAAALVARAGANLTYAWDWSGLPGFLARRGADGTWRAGPLTQGLEVTLRLAVLSGALGLGLGLAAGLGRVGRGYLWRLAGRAYVGLVRNTPPLVLVFVFYFFLGDQLIHWIGADEWAYTLRGPLRTVASVLLGPPERLPAFLSGVFALGLMEGAYFTEIVRAGVEGVERGQWEASAAQGMTRRQQLRLVILPQALQRMLPALAGQFISTIKDSAIVSIISIQELTFAGQELMAATYRTFEIWSAVLGLYFVLCFACSLWVRRLERRAARWS
ncbi:MAG: amino acid ABC transporter permease [Desulfovibrionaceae bacterium]